MQESQNKDKAENKTHTIINAEIFRKSTDPLLALLRQETTKSLPHSSTLLTQFALNVHTTVPSWIEREVIDFNCFFEQNHQNQDRSRCTHGLRLFNHDLSFSSLSIYTQASYFTRAISRMDPVL